MATHDNDRISLDTPVIDDRNLLRAAFLTGIGPATDSSHQVVVGLPADFLSPRMRSAIEEMNDVLYYATPRLNNWHAIRPSLGHFLPEWEAAARGFVQSSGDLPVLWNAIREDRTSSVTDTPLSGTCTRLAFDVALVRIKEALDMIDAQIAGLAYSWAPNEPHDRLRPIWLAHRTFMLDPSIDTSPCSAAIEAAREGGDIPDQDITYAYRLFESALREEAEWIAKQKDPGPDDLVARHWDQGPERHGCDPERVERFVRTIPMPGRKASRGRFRISPEQWKKYELGEIDEDCELAEHLGIPRWEPFHGELKLELNRHLLRFGHGGLDMTTPMYPPTRKSDFHFKIQVSPGERIHWHDPDAAIERLPWTLIDAIANAEGYTCSDSLKERVSHVHIAFVDDPEMVHPVALNVRIFGEFERRRSASEVLAGLGNLDEAPEAAAVRAPREDVTASDVLAKLRDLDAKTRKA